MAALSIDGIPMPALPNSADQITFDNTGTGMSATMTDAAIKELKTCKAETDIVAATFNPLSSYTAGNYCIHEGKFYKFKNNHSGAWSAADVDEIKIAGELSTLKSGLTNVTRNNFGSGVDVTSYNTESNMYTFPDDGYLIGFIGSDEIKVKILGATSTAQIEALLNTGVAVSVRKGMRFYVMSNTAGKLVAYVPFA